MLPTGGLILYKTIIEIQIKKPWAGIVKPNIIMKPSIGRIVHFQLNEGQREKLNNYQPTAPAIITAVWGDECVNLKVLLDGETNLWVTSAMKGTGENQWDWPVIV